MFRRNTGYDAEDSNASGPKSVNYASVPPAGAILPSNITQFDELKRNTAQYLGAPSLYRSNKFDSVHPLLIFLIFFFQ